jgi:hypothetical protein
MVCGPKYDGKYLHALLRRYFGDTRLDRTLTNVVIPTFDIAYMQPTIFSTLEVTEVLSRLQSVDIREGYGDFVFSPFF